MSVSDLPIRINLLIQLLGGETNRYVQAFLLGVNSWTITEDLCKDFHTHCVNAVLAQVPWLQKPYDDGDFESSASRAAWLKQNKCSRGPTQAILKPIERRKGMILVPGFGSVAFRDFTTGVDIHMTAS